MTNDKLLKELRKRLQANIKTDWNDPHNEGWDENSPKAGFRALLELIEEEWTEGLTPPCGMNNTAPHPHHGIDAARLMAAAPDMLEALQCIADGVLDEGCVREFAKRAAEAATSRHIPDQRTDPFDEAHELYTHGATSGIADGDDNHIPNHE
tara:strand:+ start:136 stop:591 length:456 start_codon:yes stop_codon:yes gene_type:complete